jgi:cell division protein ZapB
MELIDQLERRVESMLEEMAALREENGRLKDIAASGASAELEEENQRLREELDRERATRDAVLERIDNLLAKLKDAVGD